MPTVTIVAARIDRRKASLYTYTPSPLPLVYELPRSGCSFIKRKQGERFILFILFIFLFFFLFLFFICFSVHRVKNWDELRNRTRYDEKVCWDWVNEWITGEEGREVGVKSFSNFRACSFLGILNRSKPGKRTQSFWKLKIEEIEEKNLFYGSI